MPGPAHAAEKLDDAGIPARDVGGQFLQHRDGSFAAAIIYGFGNIEPLLPCSQPAHQAGIEQIGNVGDHPIVAGLDGLVIPKAIRGPAQNRRLLTDAVDQFTQWPIAVIGIRVFKTINRRN